MSWLPHGANDVGRGGEPGQAGGRGEHGGLAAGEGPGSAAGDGEDPGPATKTAGRCARGSTYLFRPNAAGIRRLRPPANAQRDGE